MIYYNSNTINEWNFGDDNIIKVYKHGAVCYYKITSGDTPTPEYKVCFAVVDDITQYQETEFEDVYDKATEKWYKLNNLSQYEEYGVYGDGRNITYYEGKLTIDTESSKLPSGYTEVEYITSEHLSINLNTGTYINTNYYPTDKTRVVIDYQATSSTAEHRRLFGAGHCCKNNIAYVLNMEQKYTASNREFTYRCGSGNTWVHTNIPFDLERHVADFNNDGAIYIDNTQIGTRQNAPFTATYPMYLLTDNNDGTVGLNQYIVGRVYSCQMYEDGTKIRDFVPAQRDSDSKYGLYDIVNDVFYPSSSNYSFSGGAEVTTTNEYIYSGSSWVNLGEVSGSSRVPIGYTEVEYIENTSTAYINTGFKPNQDTRIVAEMQTVTSTSYGRFLGAGSYNRTNAIQFDYETGSNGTLHVSWGTVAGWTTYSSCVGDYNKHTYDWNKNEFYRDNTLIGSVTYGNFQCTDYLAIFGNILNGTGENFMYGKMYSFQMYDNGTLIRDLVPCKMDSDNKYGAYDIVNNVFYTSPNGVNFIGGSETGSTEYPKYYTEKSDPLDDLTFNTLAEAQTYAYNNCVYDGMKATIDGDKYIFSGDSISGYEWVYQPSRLPSGYTEVEYIENTTMAYLDIGFKPNQDTRIVIDTQIVTSTNYGKILSSGQWDKINGMQLQYEVGVNGTLLIDWGTSTRHYNTNINGDYNRHIYDWNKNNFYLDETLVASTTYGNFQSSCNLLVFMASSSSCSPTMSSHESALAKLYSLKIYDNDVLSVDLVPCISPNNVVGVYDIVNDVFYGSASNNPFIAGNPI